MIIGPASPGRARFCVRRLIPLTLLLFLTVAAACQSGPPVRVSDNPAPITAVVVAPFEARYPAEPWTAYLRTTEEVRLAVEWARLPVFAHGDFDAFPLEGQDFYAGRSMLSMLEASGLNQGDVAMLRGSVTAIEVRAPRGEVNGEPIGGDVELELEVELFHLGQRQIIASGQQRFVARAVDSAGPGTPHPEITARHQALVKAVLSKAADALDLPPAQPLPVTVLEDHRRIFLIGSDEAPPLSTAMSGLDPFDQSMRRLQVYQWLYPEIDATHAASLEEHDSGLLIAESTSDEIRVGDRLLTLGRAPAETTHQLARAWLALPSGDALDLTLLRDGETLTTQLKK